MRRLPLVFGAERTEPPFAVVRVRFTCSWSRFEFTSPERKAIIGSIMTRAALTCLTARSKRGMTPGIANGSSFPN